METSSQSSSSRRPPQRRGGSDASTRTPESYKICDRVTEVVIYLSVVFGPWAFGTTKSPETWILNSMGYVLGLLLMAKWVIRWRLDYKPARWSDPSNRTLTRIALNSTRLTALATIAILLYCVLSALNARASIDPDKGVFIYNTHSLSWLPHSYDFPATWVYFLHYLGFAFTFWAVRDWLLGKTSRERRFFVAEPPGAISSQVQESIRANSEGDSRAPGELPDRLRRLLWVICISGSALALEAILQRLSGTSKLLWLVVPHWNKDEAGQFGPYAYRSNGAQYLNLVWPVCLGFWSLLRKENRLHVGLRNRVGGSAHVVLLPCAVLLMAAPIISTSRGGALIAGGGIIAAVAILLSANTRSGKWIRLGILVWLTSGILMAGYLGWDRLQMRFHDLIQDDSMSGRTEIFENSRRIFEDHKVFGVGPGAYSTVYKFYRKPGQVWHAWVHDDWLEFRITFGWVGFSLILLAFLGVCSRWVASNGILVPWEFMALTYVAVFGCLAHGKFDFPLQVHSIAHLTVILCALLFCIRRHGEP